MCPNKLVTKPKSEHVFPAAIGGGYEIFGICDTCNSKLGDLVDEPFSNHKLIGRYRYVEDVGRGKRNIKDPLKGEILIEGSSKYTLQLNKEGYGVKRLIAEYPKAEDLKKGEKFHIHVDSKDEGVISKIIDKLQKEVDERNKDKETKDKLFITNREIIEGKESQITQKDDDNKLILGFAKMLFESAAELVTGYANSKEARQYAQMLRKGRVDNTLSDCLLPNSELIKFILQDSETIFKKNENHHIIMLMGFKGVGLVGVIKVFDIKHVMILSKNKSFVSQKLITIFNNYKKEKVEIFQADRISSGKITLTPFKGITNSFLNEEFVYGECKEVKIFDINGKVRYNSIFDMVNEPQFLRIIKGDFKTSISTIHLVKNQLFVRSKCHGKLLPIGCVELIHTFKKIK